MTAGDLISQLQECNAELCAHLFNFTGAIQRDAPPASVSEEAVEAPRPLASGSDTITQIGGLASQVVHLSKQFDELAAALPETLPPREEQLRRILSLQEQVVAGRRELEAELAAAATQLTQVQQLYGQLADDRLRVLRDEGTG